MITIDNNKNKKMNIRSLEDAIEIFEYKVKNQGIVTNERDVNHLENLKNLLKDEKIIQFNK